MRKPGDKPAPGDAYDKGLGLLSRREHSARELKTKLARKGHASDDITSAIGRLRDKTYQSDDRFGISIARTRAAQGYGPARIRAELKSHGLADAAIIAAIAAADADWATLAARQLKRRFGSKVATKVQVLSGNYLLVTAPAGTGKVPVTVTNAHGKSAQNAYSTLTYTATPTPCQLSSGTGITAGLLS